ncbi:MAG: hypothetical protein HYW57_06840 [Ignavibacteriales bacterium]|nr:hypothetical protein [Ignavibacteriales bacterium]
MISAKTISQTVEKLSAQDPAQAQALVKQMSKEQPFVLAYLLASSENERFDKEESEAFFFAGVVVWHLMKQKPTGLRKVTEKGLTHAEKANEALLEKMASDSEGDFFSAAEAMALNSAEPEVLRYITQALMEDDEGNPDNAPFGEEHLGQGFLHLKIVLDAFVDSQK